MKISELVEKLLEKDQNMQVGYLDHNYITFETYTDMETREEIIYEPCILEDGSVGPVVGVKQEVIVFW